MRLKKLSSKISPMKIHIANAVEHVLLLRLMAGIETAEIRRAEERLKQKYDAWRRLCKNKREHPTQKVKAKLYCSIGWFMRYWSSEC